MTIYVEQYGGWWKLTAEQWRSICEQGAAAEGYLLPDAAQLKRRPRSIGVARFDRNGRKPYYFLRNDRNDVLICQPIDWTPDGFVEAITELDKQ